MKPKLKGKKNDIQLVKAEVIEFEKLERPNHIPKLKQNKFEIFDFKNSPKTKKKTQKVKKTTGNKEVS